MSEAKRVLIVEDRANVLQILQMLVQAYSAEWVVEGARNYRDAVGALNLCPYDLVTIDNDLGDGRTGKEVAAEIRGGRLCTRATAKLVMISDALLNEPLDRILFDDGLPKPVRMPELHAMLKRLLG